MPLPLLIGIAVAVVAVIGGTVYLNWDEIVLKLKGKRIAVLGERGVGKTTLITFLIKGEIPAEYRQTVAPEKAGSKRFKLGDLGLDVKDTLDVSGSKDAYAYWQRLYNVSDFAFYLLRVDRLVAGDAATRSRVREDLRHIEDWRKAHQSPPVFVLIGTYCDLDPGYATARPGDYSDRFRKLPIVIELIARAGGGAAVKVVLGSMKTRGDTEALVFNLLQSVAQ